MDESALAVGTFPVAYRRISDSAPWGDTPKWEERFENSQSPEPSYESLAVRD